MIRRHLFDTLLKHLSAFPVIMMLGPRFVGKTTLAKEVLNWFGRQSIYLDLEFGPDYLKLNDSASFLDANSDKCIGIDEIHRRKELLPIVRLYLEGNSGPGKFILISSNGTGMFKNHPDLIRGKVSYLVLQPLNWLEISEDGNINTHWLRGGYPESYGSTSDMESFLWRDRLIQTYCDGDLQHMGLSIDPMVIKVLLATLASNQGQIWNAAQNARSMGVTSPTIKRYVELLEEAFIVTVLQPFLTESTKRLVNAPKVYISDSGLLHTLLNVGNLNDLFVHPILHESWKGYAISQIQSVIGRKAKLFHYSTHQGSSIDLLIVRNNKPEISIDIQYSDEPKASRGYKIALKDVKTESNFILVPKSKSYTVEKDIQISDLENILIVLRNRFYPEIYNTNQGDHILAL